LVKFGEVINCECRVDYNTDFRVFLGLEKKRLMSEDVSRIAISIP